MTVTTPRARWLAMGFLCLGSFINLLDVTIVNVALPRIQSDLGATPTQLQWVAAIYVLALAAGLLPMGRFGDSWGRKRLFVGGMIGFTLASAACAGATSITMLVGARLVQGLSAAMMVPQVLAILNVTFPQEEKTRVFGLFAAVSSLASVAGPVLGGGLMALDPWGLDWRAIFIVNVPLGMVAVVGSVLTVAADRAGSQKVDWIGTALFAMTTVCLVLPSIEGRAMDWPWPLIAVLVAAIPLAGLTFSHMLRRERRGRAVLIPTILLRNASFMQGLCRVVCVFSGIPGFFLVLTVYLQSVLGLTPLQSGLATAAFPAGVMVASMNASRLNNWSLPWRIGIGAGLLVTGMTLTALVLWQIGTGITPWHLMPALLICGLGMGTVVVALFQSVMSAAAAAESGAASGALQAFQQIGAALGIAIVSSIYFGLSANGTPLAAMIAACLYPTILFALLGLDSLRKLGRKTI
ncbi:MFS transporter [Martelella radicis]|uniref:EmrB/QacA subfamily drug resistance transporter n=1 Tax=Martelella radicis TaxID=1397476 RepID=A0A7W6PAQ2_9HYPH|nr:MFS transporter [Martelella radicis]MBB4123577.1 EmrB/QacA subfamily drug resistance transporter [Martelella radicis]